MASIDLKTAFSRPAIVFLEPAGVVQASGLSHDEKLFVLRSWKRNLEQLLELSDGSGVDPSLGRETELRLAAVSRALSSLHTVH